MAEVLVRRKKPQDRWMHEKKSWLTAERLRMAGIFALQIIPGLLLTCAEVLNMPSALYVAYMTASAALDRDLKRPMSGACVAFLLRLMWGLPPRWDVLASLVLLLTARMVVYGRGTAVLMGYTAAAALPVVAAGFVQGTAGAILMGAASALVAAFSAPVMYRALKAVTGERPMDSMEERVSVGYLCAMLVCGGARMLILGVNVGVLLASVGVTALALYMGVGAASIGGMVAGVMLTTCGFPLATAAALSLGGFLAGVAQSLGRRRITCACYAVGALLALLSGGMATLGRGASVIAAAAVMALLPRTQAERLQAFLRRFLPSQAAAGDAYAASTLAAWEKTIAAMARAVPSPVAAEVSHTPQWWQDRLCQGCPDLAQCGCMLSDLGVHKAETIWAARSCPDERWEDVLEELRGMGCQRLYHLRQSMDYLRTEDLGQQQNVRRALLQRDMLVTHLTAMAGAARRFAQLSSGESWWDDVTARRIRKVIAELALPVRLSFVRRVQGRVHAAFELQFITGARQQAEDLCRLTADVLNTPMLVRRVDEDRVQLAEAPLLSITVGAAAACADGSEVCGDTVWTGELLSGGCIAALSDGMGHGDQAALESRQTVELLRLCLDAGYTRTQALTAVNGMMLLCGRGERFATVDLFTMDLWTGDAALDKLGAADSWLLHDGKLSCLSSDALPLGILEEVEQHGNEFRLGTGDILILLSDGTADAFPTKTALEDALWQALEEETAEDAARALIAAAAQVNEGCRHDDQTAVFLCIGKRETDDAAAVQTWGKDV